MGWKTLTLDEEAYGLMKKAKMPRESFGDVVRRVFMEKNADASDLVDELFRDYGGKGMMTPAARVRMAKAQASPARSSRPVRSARSAYSASPARLIASHAV
jgi:predicted CopG family antitoxin